jgi:polyisoprenyl-phosphate glycosyltransferase
MSEYIERQISVIVSVYNAEKTVRALTQRILNCSKKGNFPLLEVLLINDNSNGETHSALNELLRMDDRVSVVHLPMNLGQQKATLQGMMLAKGDIICTIDDDLEYMPEELPELYHKLKATDAEIIYGVRKSSEVAWWRRMPHRFFYFLAGLKGYPTVSSMRCLKVSLLQKIDVHCILQQPYPMIDQYLIDQAISINTVPVTLNPGRSTRQNLIKLLLHFIYFLLNHNRAEAVRYRN